MDGRILDALLSQVGVEGGARALLAATTADLVRRLGDRGSVILTGEQPRVVLSSESPDLTELPLDLGLYPEIGAALAARDVVTIENVRASHLLSPVADRLPHRLVAVTVIPLVIGDRCLGVITIQSDRARSLSARDIASARLEGRLAATLLDLQFGSGLGEELKRRSPHPAPVRLTGTDERAPRRRILIADDDVQHSSALRSILTEEGYDVLLATDGAEALRQARRLRPDLILMDVYMPEVDGFEAARKLVSDVRTCTMPILLVSGADDLLPRVRDLQLDNVDFLRKPYSIVELLARVERSLKQAESREHLRFEASIDDLTGLGNPRFLRQRLSLEQSRILRYGTPCAIVMIDVDKLKEINDRHGHLVGSRILGAIGGTLRHAIRDTDLGARYGGDEFVVVLPHDTADDGRAFAERFLTLVRQLRPEGIDVSLSLGVAALEKPDGQTVDVILAQADCAAYRAKRMGGNRVCVYDPTFDRAVTPGPVPVAPIVRRRTVI